MATNEWTALEKLLLSQAVYKHGEENWFQIARNLKHHALLDRPSDYFNQKNCSMQYYLMVEDLEKEKRISLTQDMPTVVRLARQFYSLRLEELKHAIHDDEKKFLVLLSEIDKIRAGEWDNQLLGLPPDAVSTTPTNDEYETPTENRESSNTPIGEYASDEASASTSPAVLPTNISLTEEPATTATPTTTIAAAADDDDKKKPADQQANQKIVEEAEKVQADNLEDETRVLKDQDILPTETIGESIEKSDTEAASTAHTALESVEPIIENIPTTIDDTAAPKAAMAVNKEESTENRNAIESESTEAPAISVTNPITTASKETIYVAGQKRPVDDLDFPEETELKRQKSENNDTYSGAPLDHLEAIPETPVKTPDQESSMFIKEPLTIDTQRTDYSTDVSRGTTPGDNIYDHSSLRDGTESLASSSNAATPTTDRKRSFFSKDDHKHKSWLKNINLLWREIANHKNGTMFMNPIKENIAPHYNDIVKRPMDLKTIKNRIRDGIIANTTDFERDVILMLSNSLMYNKEGTEVYQMAREMLDDVADQIKIFKTADNDSAASSHTRAASMAAKGHRRKSSAVLDQQV